MYCHGRSSLTTLMLVNDRNLDTFQRLTAAMESSILRVHHYNQQSGNLKTEKWKLTESSSSNFSAMILHSLSNSSKFICSWNKEIHETTRILKKLEDDKQFHDWENFFTERRDSYSSKDIWFHVQILETKKLSDLSRSKTLKREAPERSTYWIHQSLETNCLSPVPTTDQVFW